MPGPTGVEVVASSLVPSATLLVNVEVAIPARE
jgi:hypothetical protein